MPTLPKYKLTYLRSVNGFPEWRIICAYGKADALRYFNNYVRTKEHKAWLLNIEEVIDNDYSNR